MSKRTRRSKGRKAYRQQYKALRLEVVRVHGLRCHLCTGPIDLRCEGDEPGALTLDHLVPRRLGGTDDVSNLRPAHRRCNLAREAGQARSRQV